MPTGQDLVNLALSQKGKPYVWGAEGPNAFDCSGLIQWGAGKLGASIPRVTFDQVQALPAVPPSQLAVGDMIFSHWGDNGPASHVALYMGNDTVVHASSGQGMVTTRPMDASYWTHVDAIRRIPGIDPTPAPATIPASVPASLGMDTLGSGPGGKPLIKVNGGGGGDDWWRWLPPVLAYDWLKGTEGSPGGTVRSGLEGIGDALRGVAAGAIQVGNLSTMLTKLWLPSNQMRIAMWAFGIAFVLIGIWFLAREVRASTPK